VLASVADDFKDASNRDGCEAIPYSSERDSCRSAGRDVDEWCKNSSKKWSCDDLDPSGLNRNIDNANSKIDDLKKEVDDLDHKRNSSSDESERRDLESKIREKRDQIDALQAKVDAWKRQIDSERSMARDRQDIGERCVANRITVQKLFAAVKSKVQSESDPDAQQYVSKLVDKYTAAEKGHQEAIDITNRGIDKCKSLR
jgi:chromosome segregation ATPase